MMENCRYSRRTRFSDVKDYRGSGDDGAISALVLAASRADDLLFF